MAHKRLIENCSNDCPKVIAVEQKYDVRGNQCNEIGSISRNTTQTISHEDGGEAGYRLRWNSGNVAEDQQILDWLNAGYYVVLQIGDVVAVIGGVAGWSGEVIPGNYGAVLTDNSFDDSAECDIYSRATPGFEVRSGSGTWTAYSTISEGTQCIAIQEIKEQQCDGSETYRFVVEDGNGLLIPYTLQGELVNECPSGCVDKTLTIGKKYDVVTLSEAVHQAYSCNIETVIGGGSSTTEETQIISMECQTPGLAINGAANFGADLDFIFEPVVGTTNQYDLTLTFSTFNGLWLGRTQNRWDGQFLGNTGGMLLNLGVPGGTTFVLPLIPNANWIDFTVLDPTPSATVMRYRVIWDETATSMLQHYYQDTCLTSANFSISGDAYLTNGTLTATVSSTQYLDGVISSSNGQVTVNTGSGTTVSGGETSLLFPFDADALGGFDFGEIVTFTDIPSILEYLDTNSITYETTNINCPTQGNFTLAGVDVFSDVELQNLYFVQESPAIYDCTEIYEKLTEKCSGEVESLLLQRNASGLLEDYTLQGELSSECPNGGSSLSQETLSAIRVAVESPQPQVVTACACVDDIKRDVIFGVNPVTGEHLGWYRLVFNNAALTAEPAWVDCCEECVVAIAKNTEATKITESAKITRNAK